MTVTGGRTTVATLLAALANDPDDADTLIAALADDIEPDTRVVVRVPGAEQPFLWITEITLNAMTEHHRVDEEVIALPQKYVILVAEPPRKREGETGDDNGK